MKREDIAKIWGDPVATMMQWFIDLVDKVPSIEEVWANPDTVKIPSGPIELGILVEMLATGTQEQNVDALMKFLPRLSRYYAAIIAQDVYKRLGAGLTANKAWIDWFYKHSQMFASEAALATDAKRTNDLRELRHEIADDVRRRLLSNLDGMESRLLTKINEVSRLVDSVKASVRSDIDVLWSATNIRNKSKQRTEKPKKARRR